MWKSTIEALCHHHYHHHCPPAHSTCTGLDIASALLDKDKPKLCNHANLIQCHVRATQMNGQRNSLSTPQLCRPIKRETNFSHFVVASLQTFTQQQHHEGIKEFT